MTDTIAEHYANHGIAERILSAVRATLPAGTRLTADLLAPADQLHGRGLDATKELAALLDPKPGEHILDIGSGVGGPARWIVSHFGCRITGIDLTEAFCIAADLLNRATGLTDHVTIVHGSATALPFADQTFDRVFPQRRDEHCRQARLLSRGPPRIKARRRARALEPHLRVDGHAALSGALGR